MGCIVGGGTRDKLQTCRHGEGSSTRGHEFLTCGIVAGTRDKLQTCRHGGEKFYQTVLPPLTAIVWPVTNEASSLARYVAAQPTSSGLPQRPIGIVEK